MILEIDLGNSRIKWRLRGESGRLAGGALDHTELDALAVELAHLGLRPQQVWVASVLSEASHDPLISWSKRQWGLYPVFASSQASAGGVRNAYEKPSELGVDRWLALVAAHQSLAGPVLIVQAGTAVTVDLLSSDGAHLGGYIGPGWQLMRGALLGHTARVSAEISPPEKLVLDPGHSTLEAVEAALSGMTVGLVERALGALSEIEPNHPPQLVFAGGDGHLLLSHWPSAHWWPDLVLDGLGPALQSGA